MKTNIKQNGSVLLVLLFVLPFLALIIGSYTSLAAANFNLAKKDLLHTHAQLATDAGIDIAMGEINADPDWAGTGAQVDLHNAGNIRTSYEITVVAAGDNKTVTAIGRSFSPSTSTTPKSTITIEVNLRPVVSGLYSVVSGVGGLVMSNSAKILGGDVFINGTVTLNNSAQIGLTTNPVKLEVAHQSCPTPANSTYPTLCGGGAGEPIVMQSNSHIYGDVRANNQTTGTGMSGPGLTASSGVVPQSLPPYDRDAQKAAVTSTQTGSAASCSSGAKTWPANLHITGNVTISNSCQLTVAGNVWIDGSLEVKNSSQMIVSDALGATMPVIMVDGSTVRLTNSSLLKSNASNVGFEVITYRSDASCSPDCADVTGTDLANSQTDLTIELSNNSSAPQTIFYARWSKVSISNSGQIGALIGQTVELGNSAAITFGTSTGTGTTHWVIDGYRRVF